MSFADFAAISGFILLLILIAVYLLFTDFVYRKALPQPLAQYPGSDRPGVSIVVPFRNEAAHIVHCINSIQQQAGVEFPIELILVDDASEDDGKVLAMACTGRFPMQVISCSGQGKKAALSAGIALAAHPIVYTMDADCTLRPGTLAIMHSEYCAQKLSMLCGLINLNPAKGLFEQLQAAESAALVGISAVMLNNRMPATCNGASLMFSRHMFFEQGAYGSTAHISSGDDDLLMHAFYRASPRSVHYCMHPDAIVDTSPENNVKAFIQQRARWAGKRHLYRYPYNRRLLWLLALKFIAFWILLSCFCLGFYPVQSIQYICLLYVFEWRMAVRIKRLLQFKPYMVLLLPFYQLYMPLVLLLGYLMPLQWKGRAVRTA